MKRFKTLTDEEIVKTIAQVEEYGCDEERKPALRALFTMLANTGLRISEALALRWRTLDFERQEVTVGTLKQQRTKGLKRETVEDTIPLDANTIQALLAWRELSPQRGPNDLLFPIGRRVAYNIWQKLLHLALIRPVKVHALRHSAITRWLEDTQDLAFAQALARHRSVTSTAQYIHVTRLREKFETVRKIAPPPIVSGPERPPPPPPKPRPAPSPVAAPPAAPVPQLYREGKIVPQPAPAPEPTIGAPGSQDALSVRLARIEAMLLNLSKPQVNGNKTEVARRPAGA